MVLDPNQPRKKVVGAVIVAARGACYICFLFRYKRATHRARPEMRAIRAAPSMLASQKETSMQRNNPIRRTKTRKRVAEAFRRMARGADGKAAYASTVRFYRSGGQEWAKQLG
jgi:hypothetical protein